MKHTKITTKYQAVSVFIIALLGCLLVAPSLVLATGETMDVNISNPRVDGAYFKFEIQVKRTNAWAGGLGNCDFYFNRNAAAFTGDPSYENLNAGILGEPDYTFSVQIIGGQLKAGIYIPAGPPPSNPWTPTLNVYEDLCTVVYQIDATAQSGVTWDQLNSGFLTIYTETITPTYYGSGDILVVPPTPPTASVTTPTGTQSWDVTINYTLTDPNGDNATIIVEYSQDGGVNWSNATMGSGGDGVANLTTSSGGTAHTYVWDSFTDLGYTNQDDIQIKITPSDTNPGTPDQTTNFTVNNPNTPPTALVTTPTGTQTHDVTIEYTLSDPGPGSETATIVVQYSDDGGLTWNNATMGTGGDGLTGLITSPSPGTAHTYVWDSFADIPNTNQDDIRIKITPSDTYLGTPDETINFTVDNQNQPPTASVTTPSTTQSGDVTISYTLTDEESNSVDIAVEYSQDGGTSGSWQNATMVTGQGDGVSDLTTSPSPGTAHTYVWNSFADIPNTNQDDIRIKITPTDIQPGTADETTNFSVNNLLNISISPAIELMKGGETVTYNVNIAGVNFMGGFEIEINYSTSDFSSANLSEGTFLIGVGSTLWFLTGSAGSYVANCAILGSTSGASGSGNLFTIDLTTAASVTGGLVDPVSDNLTLPSVTLRDVNNQPITYASVTGATIIIDTEPPTENINEPAVGVYYNTAPSFATFGFGDNYDLDGIYYQMDGYGGSWTAIATGISGTSWNNGSSAWAIPVFAALSEGTHIIYFKATDDAGNVEGEAGEWSWQFYKDTTDPTMEAIAEAQGVYFNTAPSFANFGFDDGQALDDGWYQMDSFATGSWTTLFTNDADNEWNDDGWVLPTAAWNPLNEGTHTIYFKATDDAGNVEGEAGEWSWQFYKDTTDPTMEAIAEAQGVYYNTVPSFANFGFDDGQALDDGWYQMDSFAAGSWTPLFTNDADTEWNDDGWTLSTAVWNALNEGTHTIYFKATDDATNVEGEAGEWIWQFYKDTTPPAITYNYPATAGGATDWYSADPGNVINIDFVWVANSPLDYAKYKIGAGSWVAIFTADQSSDYATEWGILWTSLAEGENQISIEVADIAGNVVTHDYAASISGFLFKKDTTDPDPVTGLSAQTTNNANNSVVLSWTNPVTDVSQIQIWAKGFGDYPEYDDGTGSSPSIPADPDAAPSAGWINIHNANIQSYTWNTISSTPITVRDFYYFAIYVEDLAGNYSSVESDSALCYWLGDTDSDGNVDAADIAVLGSAFGTSHGEGSYNNVVDVGPTTDMSRIARPTTDNVIDFEDLIVFAMNYGNTVNRGEGEGGPEINPISLVLTAYIEDGQLIAELELGDNEGFVKGLRIPIIFGADLTVESVEQGDIWSDEDFFIYTDKDNVVEINGSALGNSAVIEGNGSVARITFNISGNNVDIEFGEAIARTVENEEIEVICSGSTGIDIGEIIPATYQLHQNYPNPFDGRTEIKFDLPKPSHVRISVYNVKGQLVDVLVDKEFRPGYHSTYWSCNDLSAGIYFYIIETENYIKIKKMMLLR